MTFNSAEGIVINADVNVQFAFIPDKIPLVFQAYRQDADEITQTIICSQVRDAINAAVSKRKFTDFCSVWTSDQYCQDRSYKAQMVHNTLAQHIKTLISHCRIVVVIRAKK